MKEITDKHPVSFLVCNRIFTGLKGLVNNGFLKKINERITSYSTRVLTANSIVIIMKFSNFTAI